jgi:hypothetical protein
MVVMMEDNGDGGDEWRIRSMVETILVLEQLEELVEILVIQVQKLVAAQEVLELTPEIWVVKLPMYLLHNQELLPLEQVIVVQQTQEI